MSKLKVAIIGAGGHAQSHFRMVKNESEMDAVGGINYNETRHFVECIKNDTKPWSTLEDAVKTMQLCEAIETNHKGPLS